jgi:hypothetical protein
MFLPRHYQSTAVYLSSVFTGPSVFPSRHYQYTAVCAVVTVPSVFLPRNYQYTTVYLCSVFSVLHVPSQALPVHCSPVVFTINCGFCVPSQALQVHCSLYVFSVHCALCVPSQALPLQCSQFQYLVCLVFPHALPIHRSLCVHDFLSPVFLPRHCQYTSVYLCSVFTAPSMFLPRHHLYTAV